MRKHRGEDNKQKVLQVQASVRDSFLEFDHLVGQDLNLLLRVLGVPPVAIVVTAPRRPRPWRPNVLGVFVADECVTVRSQFRRKKVVVILILNE